MRIGNLLIQQIDAAGGNLFVIMDESAGTEISFSRDQAIRLLDALKMFLPE